MEPFAFGKGPLFLVVLSVLLLPSGPAHSNYLPTRNPMHFFR
jgi:hypothetical protein